MQNIDELVGMLVEDIDEVPEDIPGTYVVWAVGHDEDGTATGAELLLAAFEDPDQAVHYARELTLADVVNFAADDECDVTTEAYSIHIEVEAVVNDEDGCAMSIGTVYKKTIKIYEELPEYVPLTAEEYELLENGDIKVPRNVLNNYNKNDCFTAIFEDGGVSQPMIYRIKSVVGEVCVCEFV